MTKLKRVVLDVLKPHIPDGLALSEMIAAQCDNCRVLYSLEEVDEKTESVIVIVEGDDLRFTSIAEAIESAGATIHSIDEVQVESQDSVTE